MKTESVAVITPEAFARRALNEGGNFLVGEYRGSKVAVVEYLDKETGRKESYVKVVHSIETGSEGGVETVHVQENIDRTIKTVDQYETWMRRGMKVVILPRSMTAEKGLKKFSCGSADMFHLASGGTTGANEKK
jgi:hypothetical protein